MENFIVSARKYRPATFDTVVGQASITTTLKNAIRNNHLGQAFLFCGPRGVGKTTCARILAKTINCENLRPEIEPCDQCNSCVSFNTSSSFNIYELDAASNNSVDDIRNLVEQVRIVPHQGRYKIYIIDEVHMLSAAAFNAFLKTLEEPPPYAIFILATTEKHKIIPTILSRCQIYDFSRISAEDIATHLAYVAGKEHVDAEPEALHVIAQKADGALRDALSIFDQVVSFSGNKVTYHQVIDNLNVLDTDYYFNITSHLRNGDIAAALLLYNEIINKGFDGHNFIGGLAAHFRDLMMCRQESTISLLDASIATKEKFKSQAASCSGPLLLEWLNIAGRCDLNYKAAKNQRLLVEISLMKMCTLSNPSWSSPSGDQKKNDIPPIVTAPVVVKKPEPIQTVSPEITAGVKESDRTAPKATPVETPSPPLVNDIPAERAKTYVESSVTHEKEKIPETTVSVKSPAIPRTVSILGIKPSSATGAENAPPEKVNTVDPFTQEELSLTWKAFAEQMAEQGKKSLYSTLTSHEPLLQKDFIIEFEVDNIANTSTIKTEITEHLRRKLKNASIMLNVVVRKKQEEHPVPYSTSEKFKKMADKNPMLDEMKKQFDLEIDF